MRITGAPLNHTRKTAIIYYGSSGAMYIPDVCISHHEYTCIYVRLKSCYRIPGTLWRRMPDSPRCLPHTPVSVRYTCVTACVYVCYRNSGYTHSTVPTGSSVATLKCVLMLSTRFHSFPHVGFSDNNFPQKCNFRTRLCCFLIKSQTISFVFSHVEPI